MTLVYMDRHYTFMNRETIIESIFMQHHAFEVTNDKELETAT